MTQPRVLSRFLELGRREIIINRAVCGTIGVCSFIVVTALGAFVRVPLPFTPVPITLQTFFVLLAGAALGRRLGMISQTGYITLGGLGLPIFAGATGGFTRLLGPTGGYLLGFIVAAWAVGRLIEFKKRPDLGWIVFSMLVGSLSIYLLGMVQLALVTQCGIKGALYMGVLPFIPGDTLKLLAAALLYRKFEGRFKIIFQGK